jgi:hypothetical protein
MPAGTTAAAVTFAQGLIAVVTTDGRILVFGSNGKLRQELRLSAEAPQP